MVAQWQAGGKDKLPKEHKATLVGDGNVYYPDGGDGITGKYICQEWIKLYSLNIHSSLYFYYTSVKLGKIFNLKTGFSKQGLIIHKNYLGYLFKMHISVPIPDLQNLMRTDILSRLSRWLPGIYWEPLPKAQFKYYLLCDTCTDGTDDTTPRTPSHEWHLRHHALIILSHLPYYTRHFIGKCHILWFWGLPLWLAQCLTHKSCSAAEWQVGLYIIICLVLVDDLGWCHLKVHQLKINNSECHKCV